MAKKEHSPEQIISSIKDLWLPLNEEQRKLLASNLTLRKYKKNEFIYKEGDTPSHLMCLLSGKVKICKEGFGGRSQIIRVMKQGDYFGYRAHFSGTNRITSAAAFEPSVICHVPLSILSKFIRENSEIAVFFLRQLAHGLSIADARAVNMTQKHIRGRLAEAILKLKTRYGFEEDGTTLNINVSREDLANMSNMTTSNAIRTLSAFATEGIIGIEGKKIKLLDEDEILRICHGG
ncbi:MAG: Crp/Fnr family transcriptional regulator [Bacteroidales bacterium]|nr:Crp/Fnr family transcriptional regulator [Bacteroidales bacterium]